jgi:hypothetical protein
MTSVLISILTMLRGVLRSRAALHLEILALRHQLQVLQRPRPRRLRLTTMDRWLWAWLARSWSGWRTALVIVKPDTVIGWHRKGFRLFWTWKSRRRGGRPPVPPDVRALIRTMSRDNALWGAPRIHGELLKLGVDVSQATVAKYMIRPTTRPSQFWRTFLTDHVHQIAAADFFVVPTATCRLLFVLVSPRARTPPNRSRRRHRLSHGGVRTPSRMTAARRQYDPFFDREWQLHVRSTICRPTRAISMGGVAAAHAAIQRTERTSILKPSPPERARLRFQ